MDLFEKLLGAFITIIAVFGTIFIITGMVLDIKRQLKRNRMSKNGKLSPRELEVLSHVSVGHGVMEIASTMNISSRTVEVHLRNIRQLLSARSTSHAVAIALRNKWIS